MNLREVRAIVAARQELDRAAARGLPVTARVRMMEESPPDEETPLKPCIYPRDGTLFGIAID
jgi:hypothetical protein